ncbi:hypothetical protein ACHAXT_001970 [Thalassiosira profunda]
MWTPVALLLPLLLASAAAALRPGEVSMGTTILAVRFDGGIVVGADTRTSVSGYVSNRRAAKLTFVLDRDVDEYVAPSRQLELEGEGECSGDASTCVLCRSGSAADTQRLASVVRSELVSRRLLYRVKGTVTHAASLLRNLLVSNEDLSASLLCAGYDHELKRGVIYSISPGGTMFEERAWAAGGSGSTYILGHLDSLYPKEGGCQIKLPLRSEEEAVALVRDSIGLAMERDGSSGGYVRMYVVDRRGKRPVATTPAGDAKEERGRGRSPAEASVKGFAAAIAPAKQDRGGLTSG